MLSRGALSVCVCITPQNPRELLKRTSVSTKERERERETRSYLTRHEFVSFRSVHACIEKSRVRQGKPAPIYKSYLRAESEAIYMYCAAEL